MGNLPVIREARDGDSDQLIALIGAVFSEYPGCVLDVDGEMPELLAIATAFKARGGYFWVAEKASRVVGCVGITPVSERKSVAELRKLYVAAGERRSGLGTKLVERVEATAQSWGVCRIELWTDTRFEAAHRFYAGLGFVQGSVTRALHDKSATVEYFYSREF